MCLLVVEPVFQEETERVVCMYMVSGHDGPRPGGNLTTRRNPSGSRFYLVIAVLLIIVYCTLVDGKSDEKRKRNDDCSSGRSKQCGTELYQVQYGLQCYTRYGMGYSIIPGTVWATVLYQVQYRLQYYTRYSMDRPTTENTYRYGKKSLGILL